MASSPSPGAVPTTPQATPPLPSGWVQCTDPTHGVPYYFDLERKCSQWEFPSAPSAAPTPPAAMPTSVATSEYSLDMSAAADEGGGASRDEPEGFADFGAFATAAAAPAGELSSPLPLLHRGAGGAAFFRRRRRRPRRPPPPRRPPSGPSRSRRRGRARRRRRGRRRRANSSARCCRASPPSSRRRPPPSPPPRPRPPTRPPRPPRRRRRWRTRRRNATTPTEAAPRARRWGCQSDGPPTRGAAAQTEVDAAAAEEEAEAAEAERARVAGLRRRCERASKLGSNRRAPCCSRRTAATRAR